jgi:NNP family nitrate/nitrite transporter-like MFS transporter
MKQGMDLDSDSSADTSADQWQADVKPFRADIGPLVLLTAMFFLNFIGRVTFAPLMPEIEMDLGITHAEAGSFFLLISIGYSITLFGSGWVAARFTHKQTIMISSLAMSVVLIGTAASTSLWAIRAGLLLLGMAGGLYLPSAIATLTGLFSTHHWGKAIAVHELAPTTAFVAAPLLSELMLVVFSWRVVLFALGAATLLVTLAFARFGRGGAFTGEAPGIRSFKVFLVSPAFWIMVVLFGLGISSTLGIYTMLPLYLVSEHGIERNFANTLVALSRVATPVMALVGGWAGDRFGPRKTLIGVFFLTGIATIMIGVLSGGWILPAVFAQPLLAVGFFPAGFAALSRIGPPGARNIAVSLTVPAAFLIGGGVVPSFIGLMGDWGAFTLGIALVGGCITAGAVLAYLLKLGTDPGDSSTAK